MHSEPHFSAFEQDIDLYSVKLVNERKFTAMPMPASFNFFICHHASDFL